MAAVVMRPFSEEVNSGRPMPTRAAVVFSFRSPADRLFPCTGRAGRQREEIGLEVAFGGSRAISRALGRTRPRGRVRGSLCSRSAGLGDWENRGRAVSSRAVVSGNRGHISAIPPMRQAIFSSSIGSGRTRAARRDGPSISLSHPSGGVQCDRTALNALSL